MSKTDSSATFVRRRCLTLIACLVAILFAGVVSAVAAETITTATLLDEMTDLAGMAEFPDPAYTCKQFSSYDRGAKSPEENWFANGDCGQYLRVEDHAGRLEHVIEVLEAGCPAGRAPSRASTARVGICISRFPTTRAARSPAIMAVTAYWYARPGSTDEFQSIRAEDVVLRPMTAYVVPRVPGALEGEEMEKVRVTGTADPQDWDGLSGGRHLWWQAGMQPGDELAVSFPAPQAGKYRIIGHFLRARDYGIHQLAINGQAAGEPIDFYNPSVQPSPELELGIFELKAAGNELSVKVVGANEQAVKAYMFGLDYLLLKPVD